MDLREAAHILGVSEDAPWDDVRGAHRSAARRNHPDANGASAGELMRRVNEAYEVLQSRHAPLPRISTGDDSGATQHVSIARLRAMFSRNPLDRFWPAWLVVFALAAVYTGWATWQFNPLGMMLGAHVLVAFGLLSWNEQSKRAIFGRGRCVVARARADDGL
jgi:hypothetical protein